MRVNIAAFERAARAWVGMILLASPLLELDTYPYNLIGIVLLVTAVAGYCPAHALFRRLRGVKGPSLPSVSGASRA